jgi:hypothetical protein
MTRKMCREWSTGTFQALRIGHRIIVHHNTSVYMIKN